jgi:hypothetical protein
MKLRMYLAFFLLAIPLLLFIINLRIVQLVMWLLGPKPIKFSKGTKSYLRSRWFKLRKFQHIIHRIITN